MTTHDLILLMETIKPTARKLQGDDVIRDMLRGRAESADGTKHSTTRSSGDKLLLASLDGT